MNHCLKCQHKWETRKKSGAPYQCPHCKNPKWTEPKRVRDKTKETVQREHGMDVIRIKEAL